jgi:predicted patatin/cPLA2 family phospholipase
MYKILSIDGGGTKGIVPATFISEFEKRSDKRMCDVYDCYIGTSTGAILAGAMGIGLTGDEIVDIYHNDASKIFKKEKKWWRTLFGATEEKYETRNLYNALFRNFGDVRMGDLKRRVIVTAYDIETRKNIIFDSEDPNHKDLLLADCVTASAAAPTYFEPHSFGTYRVVDGGVSGMNNPVLVGYVAAIRKGFDKRAISICSLGTGKIREKIPYGKAIDWGLIQWVKPVIDILMSGTADLMDKLAQYLVTDNLYRVNIQLPNKGLSAMDSPENMKELEKLARTYANEKPEVFYRIITKQWT